MLNFLLDIAPLPQVRRPHHVDTPTHIDPPDIVIEVPTESPAIDSLRQASDTLTDSLAIDSISAIDTQEIVVDSAAQSPLFTHMGGTGHDFLWLLPVALMALALCCYFIYAYRRVAQAKP